MLRWRLEDGEEVIDVLITNNGEGLTVDFGFGRLPPVFHLNYEGEGLVGLRVKMTDLDGVMLLVFYLNFNDLH